jgi:ankyrin repeat protein
MSAFFPLHAAAAAGDFDAVVHCVVARHCRVNEANAAGDAPLMLAAEGGHAGSLRFLLEYPGVDAGALDRRGLTAAHRAALAGQPETLRALAGVMVTSVARPTPTPLVNLAVASSGETPLSLALRGGHAAAALALMDAAGPTLDVLAFSSPADGRNLAHVAVEMPTVLGPLLRAMDRAVALSERTAPAPTSGASGGAAAAASAARAPLPFTSPSSRRGRRPSAASAPVASSVSYPYWLPDASGMTPLHLCALGDLARSAQLLLDHGAPRDERCASDGRTALIIARQLGHTKTAAVLDPPRRAFENMLAYAEARAATAAGKPLARPLAAPSDLAAALAVHPFGMLPLLELGDAVLGRDASELSVLERATLAAFVNDLTAPAVQWSSSSATFAQRSGLSPAALDVLRGSLDAAGSRQRPEALRTGVDGAGRDGVRNDDAEAAAPSPSPSRAGTATDDGSAVGVSLDDVFAALPVDTLLPSLLPTQARALLRFVRELVLRPGDAPVLAALRTQCAASCITDPTLHDAIFIASVVGMMVRLAAGHGAPSVLGSDAGIAGKDARRVHVNWAKQRELVPLKYAPMNHEAATASASGDAASMQTSMRLGPGRMISSPSVAFGASMRAGSAIGGAAMAAALARHGSLSGRPPMAGGGAGGGGGGVGSGFEGFGSQSLAAVTRQISDSNEEFGVARGAFIMEWVQRRECEGRARLFEAASNERMNLLRRYVHDTVAAASQRCSSDVNGSDSDVVTGPWRSSEPVTQRTSPAVSSSSAGLLPPTGKTGPVDGPRLSPNTAAPSPAMPVSPVAAVLPRDDSFGSGLTTLRTMFVRENFQRNETEMRFAIELRERDTRISMSHELRDLMICILIEASGSSFAMRSLGSFSRSFSRSPHAPKGGGGGAADASFHRGRARLIGNQLVVPGAVAASPVVAKERLLRGTGTALPRPAPSDASFGSFRGIVASGGGGGGGGAGGAFASPLLDEDVLRAAAISDEALRVQFDALDRQRTGAIDKVDFRGFICDELDDYGVPRAEHDFERAWDAVCGRSALTMRYEQFCLFMLRRAKM